MLWKSEKTLNPSWSLFSNFRGDLGLSTFGYSLMNMVKDVPFFKLFFNSFP
ncbi:hypothetical protein HanIR_Chr16g0789381 [Helianthus annuus]|nr:hypothetical protein HanIR_Chr16g0789381 [Helianthus annuus]